MDSGALWCRGPYLARRLLRLADIVRLGGEGTTALFVRAAGVHACESAPGNRGSACICAELDGIGRSQALARRAARQN